MRISDLDSDVCSSDLLRSISSAGGISSDSNTRSKVAITLRTFVVVASTPDAAASTRSMHFGNASSGMPFGGASQNATINPACSKEQSPARTRVVSGNIVQATGELGGARLIKPN